MALKELKSVDAMSLAVISAVIAAIWGFVAGIFMVLGTGMAGTGMVPMAGFGLATVIVFPIVYAIVGFIGGAVTAFVYNIVAQRIGGIKLDL